jgi:hypothetical protein
VRRGTAVVCGVRVAPVRLSASDLLRYRFDPAPAPVGAWPWLLISALLARRWPRGSRC